MARSVLDTARRIATDPATPGRVAAAAKGGAAWAGDRARCLARAATDPAARAEIRRDVKDGLAKTANRVHPALLRASRGRVGARVGQAPVLLLTTTGRKSGKERTVALLYLAEGDRYVVVASYGGDDRSPAWLLNLQDDPAVTVEVEGERRPMTASVATAAEKARLWPKVVELYKGYDDYRQRTARDIPLVWLDPV